MNSGRTVTLLKVKNFYDEEAIVIGLIFLSFFSNKLRDENNFFFFFHSQKIGHEKGTGRLQNSMGSIQVRTPDGREFSIGSGKLFFYF